MDPKKITILADSINKKYGKGTFSKVADESNRQSVDAITTGSLTLDLATGIGGFPRGRIVELYGPESSGKTTLTLHAIAAAQKQGIGCAFIDVEHAFDPSYAEALGVDCEELWFAQPSCEEEALGIMNDCLKSKQFGLIVLDSVAGLSPRSEIEGEIGESKMGLVARILGQSLRMMIGAANESNCCIIFLNQIREKIGVMFGSPEYTTGGNSLKFFASMRIDIRKSGASTKDGDEVIGNPTKVKITKNKLAPPFKTAEFTIMFGKGVSRATEIVDLGVQYEILEKSGSWYGYEGNKLAQGKNQMTSFFEDNPEFAQTVEQRIIKVIS
jgi:recombination protein RecA